MTNDDYDRIVRKYRSPFHNLPHAVVMDMRVMLDHVEVQAVTIRKQLEVVKELRSALKYATQTMMAFVKTIGGCLEIPFQIVEDLGDNDTLHVEDVHTPSGAFKRFSYRAKDDPRMTPDITPGTARH